MARRNPRGEHVRARLMAFVSAAAMLAAGLGAGVALAEEPANIAGHTVAGVSPRGTTIDLFDYWLNGRDEPDNSNPPNYRNLGINAGHMLKFGKGMGQNADTSPANLNSTTVNEWTMSAAPRSGIVASRLGGDGYPVLSGTGGIGTESLAYLFDGSSGEGKQAFTDVGDLLQVDADGYYHYDSMANFAQFNEGANDFTLYDTWGVRKGGDSPDGQFFPFNTGSQVFDEGPSGLQQKTGVTSTSPVINHYFGVRMGTRFIQQDGGYTGSGGNRQEVTYNFSGDDDVWVFVDDVLVGDLGGIHDRTSLEINFHDGHVYVYDDTNTNNRWDPGERRYQDTTIAALMRQSGATDGLNGDTFEDGTYHTLDFFYLERGNTDSNMSLKYNLVVPPETDIVKIDQDGEPVSDARFAIYVADANYGIQGGAVCSATTDADGSVVLLDDNDNPITFDRLWDLYGDRGDGLTQSVPAADGGGRRVNLVLRETAIPEGYRSPGDMRMYLWHKDSGEAQGPDSVNLLLSDMSTERTEGGTWRTGIYSQTTVLVTAPNRLAFTDGTGPVETQTMTGRLFVIVEKRTDNGWVPVYGSHTGGWTVAPDDGWASVQAADDATGATFLLASSGSHQTLIDGLPGRIQDYVFFNSQGNGEFRGAYYYTTAGAGTMSEANTHRVSNSDGFTRQFAAHLYVPNIINRVIVQKTDESGVPLNGAEFTMYRSNQEGTAPDRAQQVGEPVTTRDLDRETDRIALSGAAIFAGLTEGTYWIVETGAPAGYAVDATPAKVIVTGDGVYADAGVKDDGVRVTRGVGRLVRSMLPFAVDDDIDATINQIVATPQVGDTVGDWEDAATGSGAVRLHLRYAGDDAALDYDVQSPTTEADRRFTVDEGIPYLKVQQCNDDTVANPDNAHVIDPRVYELGDTDITGLFTGVTIVQVADRQATLRIAKTVEGEHLPPSVGEQEFTFTITLKQSEGGAAIAGSYPAVTRSYADGRPRGPPKPAPNPGEGTITFNDAGQATVTLRKDQCIVIGNLPVGAWYEVAETNIPEGYAPDPTYQGDPSGTFTDAGDGTADVSLTVTNTYTVVPVATLPLTGSGATTARGLLLAGGGMLLAAGAAWLLARRRRV